MEDENNNVVHEDAPPAPEYSNVPAPPTSTEGSAWSWGGFMFWPLVVVATKKYRYLFFFLLYLIPLVNLLAAIGLKIYFGLNARGIVGKSTFFDNKDESKGFMKGIDHAGFIFFIVSVIGIALGMVFFFIMVSAYSGGF